MLNFILIIFCIAAGFILRRLKVLPADGHKSLNIWVIYIALPAMAFKYLPHLVWSSTLWLAIGAPVLLFLGSIMFFKLLAPIFYWSQRTSHSLILLAGLSNTSFVGFPLVATYFGDDQLQWAIVCDQATFFLLATLGVWYALKGQGKRDTMPTAYFLRRIFSFPPFLALLAALLLPRFIDISPLAPFFHQLASTVSPIALFSIGMQLSFNFYKAERAAIWTALSYKLLLGPMLIILLFYSLNLKADVVRVATFEMAMPCLVSTSLVIQEFKLNAKLGNAIIGLSIFIGLFSSYVMYLLINLLL